MPEARKRLTYVMLFRVGVVTLLLGATFMSELAGTMETALSPRTYVLLALIGVTYLLTILYSLWLRSIPPNAPLGTLAIAQIAIDLLLTTALVHLTGAVDSGFAFMYLLTVVSASFVIERSALFTAIAAVALYGADIAISPAPLKEMLRVVGVNAVAFVATGLLAARLAVELSQARGRIERQGVRIADLATLHADVIRCLTSGLVTLDRDGVVITFNAAAEEILGIQAASAAGRRIGELMPELAESLASVGERSSLKRAEVTHGERALGVSASPLYDAAGQVLGRIVSFQDLTELRRMEEAVARSEHLAAVGRLAAGVAHEIRNPLAAISGSIELLARDDGKASDRAQLTEIVLREVARLDALIRELLEFARPRKPEPQRLDLRATLGELARVFEHDKQLAGAPVELHADGAVWVEADPAQLRQVVWNLLRNAAEAAPAGSPITLGAGETRDADGSSWGWLAVRDRGPGIPVEQRARLFEPFYSTKEKGTGLGLAVVHRIVEAHHGRIDVESPTGGGTRVCVRLPLAT
jgi:two-component system sensor histidine kinase PilS (NtrC family)